MCWDYLVSNIPSYDLKNMLIIIGGWESVWNVLYCSHVLLFALFPFLSLFLLQFFICFPALILIPFPSPILFVFVFIVIIAVTEQNCALLKMIFFETIVKAPLKESPLDYMTCMCCPWIDACHHPHPHTSCSSTFHTQLWQISTACEGRTGQSYPLFL